VRRYPWYSNEYGDVDDVGLTIVWQRGPLDLEVNGASPDMIVRAMMNKFEMWIKDQPSSENVAIHEHLSAILGLLDERTRDRARRGVVGTDQP
jgi:hypothetical protein